MRSRRVSDPPAWIWFVIPAVIAVPVIAGILIAGPMLGFMVAAVMALAIVAAAWRDGARGPGAATWRRAAARRFLVALAVAVAGIVVVAVGSGSVRIVGWGVVGVELGGSRLGAYSDGSMPDFFPVMANGRRVGKVTSACFSPRLEKNIGFAMLPVEHSELGTELVVERPGETIDAVVADRVFFKPEHAEQRLSSDA